jgi:putative endonuclease
MSTRGDNQRYFCYIVVCADGTYYTGWTNDPARRTKQHNQGRGARYTRQRGPVRLVYVEELPDRSSAMRREVKIKQMSRPRKQALIAGQQGSAWLAQFSGGEIREK